MTDNAIKAKSEHTTTVTAELTAWCGVFHRFELKIFDNDNSGVKSGSMEYCLDGLQVSGSAFELAMRLCSASQAARVLEREQ